MGFKENWGYVDRVSKILFVLIILYVIVSVYILAWGLGSAPGLAEDDDLMWIGYAIVSFVLATIIAAYHLTTMMFRRKRETDRLIHHTNGSSAT